MSPKGYHSFGSLAFILVFTCFAQIVALQTIILTTAYMFRYDVRSTKTGFPVRLLVLLKEEGLQCSLFWSVFAPSPF